MSEELSILDKYQKKISEGILQATQKMEEGSALSAAVKYALLNGGKKLRPAIALMVADALSHSCFCCWSPPFAEMLPAALAVEFFHTASLVADDLPCMDDDDQRRSKPSVHKVYGESLALLASYALIAFGFSGIAETAKKISESTLPHAYRGAYLGILALENASFNTGLSGATGGQLLDLFPPNLSPNTLREMMKKKTASLFEISFVFGWLFGGGNEAQLSIVRDAASHFGLAFQIADDLGDVSQDLKNERVVNLANVLGEEEARRMLLDELDAYRACLGSLKIGTPPLLFLAEQLCLDFGNCS